jgi:hypothetical protein
MKINTCLDCLIEDLETFEPGTLTDIVTFVRNHEDYSKITMLARNSTRFSKYLLNQCLLLVSEENPISDIQLAGLLVIVADANSDLYKELVSSASNGVGNYHWSRAMAASYLIQKEVFGETICQSSQPHHRLNRRQHYIAEGIN